jgi:hypothetical protein
MYNNGANVKARGSIYEFELSFTDYLERASIGKKESLLLM